jgi:hypothetical protein
LNAGPDICINRAASPEEVAQRALSGPRLRPVMALLGLMLVAIVTLFGVASSPLSEQAGVSMLLSCGPCHD